jgi:KaiC/GvpD/RAD55 family RecA-like ATPase
VSADSTTDRSYETTEGTLHTVVDADELGESVLFVGPAMTGKQTLAIDLLSAVTRAYGHPFAVTTTDTPTQLTSLYRRLVSESDDLRELVVIDCLPDGSPQDTDENVYAAGSPGDLSGIAMAVSDAFENTPGREDDGPRLLVDNLATLLLYANVETVTRFVHALMRRVTQQGGILVGTLDTDGVADEERQALSRLFDSVLEVRDENGTTELRLQDGSNDWQPLTKAGDD